MHSVVCIHFVLFFKGLGNRPAVTPVVGRPPAAVRYYPVRVDVVPGHRILIHPRRGRVSHGTRAQCVSIEGVAMAW